MAIPAMIRISALPNGLEMSRPASPRLVSHTSQRLAGRVGSIELLGCQGHWGGGSHGVIHIEGNAGSLDFTREEHFPRARIIKGKVDNALIVAGEFNACSIERADARSS